jgi:hypothetical protein
MAIRAMCWCRCAASSDRLAAVKTGRNLVVAATLSRIAAAIVGGFVATAAIVIAIPALVAGNKVQWVMGASLVGFALWTAAAIWSFAAATATRAWVGLALVTVVGAAITFVAGVSR